MPMKKDGELEGCRRTVAVGHSASQYYVAFCVEYWEFNM